MTDQYFKRYRLEYELRGPIPEPVLPAGFLWGAWNPGDADRHAAVKCAAFESELDADVFPCLGSYRGCRQLMRDIASQPGFLPGCTWLVLADHRSPQDSGREPDMNSVSDVGTIQGVVATDTLGSIQNVGVTPEYRGRGLGRALVLKALHGFQAAGLQRAYLEVTASNLPALQLYQQLGFRRTRTMYRAVELDLLATAAD
jgi:GNAT superfamily N-acetyltransferase